MFFFWRDSPKWARASSFTRFLDHTQRRTTVSRTPLDERSARRRYLYLTTYNTHKRKTSMPTVGFEPTISAGKQPQTHTLDSAATGTGPFICTLLRFSLLISEIEGNRTKICVSHNQEQTRTVTARAVKFRCVLFCYRKRANTAQFINLALPQGVFAGWLVRWSRNS